MKRLLGFLPFLLVVVPFGILHGMGAEEYTVVVTGMIPESLGLIAVIAGFAYIFSSLAATVLGPPLFIAGVVFALTC